MGENSVEYQAGDCIVDVDGVNAVVTRVIRDGNTVEFKEPEDPDGPTGMCHRSLVSPVHPSKVGQRVRCLKTPPSCVRQYVGKCGSVVKATDDGWADVLFDGMDDSRWAPFNHFIVISDSPRIVECQMVRVLVEQYSHGKGVLPKGSTGIVENCDQEFASVIVGAQGWTIPLTDLEPVEATEQPAEQGDEVRCPWCGSKMTGEPILEPDCDNWLAICSNKDCQASGPVVSGDEIDEVMRLEALSAARQRHQEEGYGWVICHTQEDGKTLYARFDDRGVEWVEDANNACHYLTEEDANQMAYGEECDCVVQHKRTRPVPAPKEYTLEDLPEIEGVRWERDKDVYGNEWRIVGFDTKFSANRVVVGSGIFETESEAVQDILHRIGRPFAEAANNGKDGE